LPENHVRNRALSLWLVESSGARNCWLTVGVSFQAGFQTEIPWELENKEQLQLRKSWEHPATISGRETATEVLVERDSV
jgi:hypothetical protein